MFQNEKWLSQSVSQSVTMPPIELSTDSVWTARKHKKCIVSKIAKER